MKKRHRKRNPSSHPILTALATWLVESVAQVVVAGALVPTGRALTPSQSVVRGGAAILAVAGGGYALGAHLFPRSKTPILVGSLLSVLFSSWAISWRATRDSSRFQPGDVVKVPVAMGPNGVMVAMGGAMVTATVADPAYDSSGLVRLILADYSLGPMRIINVSAPPSMVQARALAQ